MTAVGSVVSEGFLVAAGGLIAIAVLLVYRAVAGPTTPDRVVAINGIGTTTVVVIALLAGAFGRPGFLDVALVYAMLNFLLSLGIARFAIERGGVL